MDPLMDLQDFIRKYPELVAEYNEWRGALVGPVRLESRKAEVVKGGKEGVAKGTTLQGSGSASSSRLRGKLVPEVRECLLSGPKTTEEMKKLVQRKHPTLEIREEDLISTLNAKELDALQVRGVWVLAGTGTESHDKFRKTLLTLFKSKDSVTRQDVMEEYERVHGERCKLSDYIIRQQLREIAEKIEDGGGCIFRVTGANGAKTADILTPRAWQSSPFFVEPLRPPSLQAKASWKTLEAELQYQAQHCHDKIQKDLGNLHAQVLNEVHAAVAQELQLVSRSFNGFQAVQLQAAQDMVKLRESIRQLQGDIQQLSQEQEVHKKEAADVLAEAPGAWDDLGLTPKETPSPGKRMKTDTPKAREVFMALTLEKRTPWC
ncbi:Uncharacterized protein SCF082_LOCUS20111 [Durusdinium trenchii]|uniref:Uncharacterized protein n=1 Tax=Durusdinium trenchii TaxID=1381693 RepID=A0ABP0L288_9DINO